MPTTYVEVLPAQKSSLQNAIKWTPSERQPGAGLLEICTTRLSATYFNIEYGTPWDGRAFNLSKVTPGSDPESESYDVFCHRGGQNHQCSCKGFAYGRGRACKHIEAALALISNNWLRSELVNPEQDVASTECPF
ncbi:MAG TPA: SWIM zinc finger family protein [Gemmata sp.]|jgi:hypothetical protein|nr:SWIM zinc finger family protein [Gemmata sp.]